MAEDMILKWSKYWEMVSMIAKYDTLKNLIIEHKDMIDQELYDFMIYVIGKEEKHE